MEGQEENKNGMEVPENMEVKDNGKNPEDPEMQKLIEKEKKGPVVENNTDENKKGGVGFGHFGGEDSDDEYDSQIREEKLSKCCCCLCVCENDITAGYTCCCCLPIKCGIMVIGCLTIGLCFYYISWNFFLILND